MISARGLFALALVAGAFVYLLARRGRY